MSLTWSKFLPQAHRHKHFLVVVVVVVAAVGNGCRDGGATVAVDVAVATVASSAVTASAVVVRAIVGGACHLGQIFS